MTLTPEVRTSRSAIPSPVTAFSTRSMAALFWVRACAAVAACVTTPAVTSAVSGGAAAVPEPTTVIEGAGSCSPADGARPEEDAEDKDEGGDSFHMARGYH